MRLYYSKADWSYFSVFRYIDPTTWLGTPTNVTYDKIQIVYHVAEVHELRQ
jgi:hypothetical protein